MKKICFLCNGDNDNNDALVYQEIPPKERGEEFFVFLASSSREYDPVARRLFRSVISTSRLGHPRHYFKKILELVAGSFDTSRPDDGFLSEAMILIMLRRGNEVHAFRSKSMDIIHWSQSGGVEYSFGSSSGVEEVNLVKTDGQVELFEKKAEDYFVLNRFLLTEGTHTLLFVPSIDYYKRYKEVFLDSIFFPSFDPGGREGIDLDTSLTFPAMHWNIKDVNRDAKYQQTRSKDMIRKWMPLATGAAAVFIAIILIFNPFNSGSGDETNGERVLLSATDGDVSGGEAEQAVEEISEAPYEEAGNQPVADVSRGASLSIKAGWKKKFDAPVTSSPLVVGDNIFFGCRDSYLYSFSTDGNLNWRYPGSLGIGASPFHINGMIIGADYAGNVFCLDAASGARKWLYESGIKIVSSPRAIGNLVIAGTTGGELIALDLNDGKRLWKQKLGNSIWASPSVGKDYIIAATTDGSLVRLDHSGKIQWRISPGGSIHSSPLTLEGENLVIFGSGDNYVYAYSLKEGNLMWRFSGGSDMVGAPSTDGERIYIGSEDGMLYAVSTTGSIIWKKDMGGAIRSKPLLSGGMVFVTTYKSRLSAVDSGTGRMIDEYIAESPIYSSPATNGTMIYFGSNEGFFHAAEIKQSTS